MTIEQQIKDNIESQPEPKRGDMKELHDRILKVLPGCKLWFDTGKNDKNETVTNPTIGYGEQTIKYADGKTKEFFQIGMCANATGISVYILGIEDKALLAREYGPKIGKAKVTGYCIRFRKLKDIDVSALEAAIRYGAEVSNK